MLGLISSAVKVSDEAEPLPKCRHENFGCTLNDSTLHHSREMNEIKTFYAAQKKRMERREPCRGSVDSTSARHRQTDSQTERVSERPIFRNEMSGIVAQKSERNVRRRNGRGRGWQTNFGRSSLAPLTRPSVHPTNLTSDFRERAGASHPRMSEAI